MINNPDREIYAIPDACFDIQFVYENSTFIPYVCGTHTQVSRAFISDSRKIFAVKFEPGVVPDFIKEYACELVCARKFYPGGVPYLCMFDVGDSFYTLGTTYALAQVRLNQGNKSEKCSEKLDIENPIIRINTAFKGCSSLEKISVLPRIYHN